MIIPNCGSIAAAILAVALTGCSRTPRAAPRNSEQTLIGVYRGDPKTPQPPPARVLELAQTVAPVPDIIRGCWSSYPYGPDAGLRVTIRVNSRIWTEILPSGKTTNFLIETRAVVNGQPGVIGLRLRSPTSKSAKSVPLEGFTPDAGTQAKVGLFRIQENGVWGEWKTGTVTYEFK